MAFAAAIPLIASLIPAIGGLFGGGGDKEGGGGGGKGENLAATQAALGTVLANKEGGSGIINDHPVTKGTDIPPILAATMNQTKSGHVVPGARAGQRGVLHPPLEAAIEQIRSKQQTEPVLRHTEKAARASVKRVNETLAPQLQQLAKGMRDRAVQVQATAEHRAIVDRDARWRQMAQKQAQIIQKLDRIDRQLTHRWHV